MSATTTALNDDPVARHEADRLINRQQAMTLTGLKDMAIRRREAVGKFPKRKYDGRSVRYRLGDILDYVKDPENWKPRPEPAKRGRRAR